MRQGLYIYVSMLKYPGLYIFFSLVVALITNFITRNNDEFSSQYAIIVNAAAVIITFQYIFRKYRNNQEVQSTFSSFKKVTFFYLLGAITAAILCVIFIDCLLYVLDFYNIFPGQFNMYRKSVQSLFSGKFGIIEVLLLSTLIPLFEEFLFRGLLFNQLKSKFPLTKSMIIQVAIFGLIHGMPIQIVYAIVIGIVFSLLYIYSDSLWTCFVAHMVFNFLNLLQYFINEKSPTKAVSTFALEYAPIILTLTPALLIFLLLYIRSVSRKKSVIKV